jgi:hypothetical protein
MPCLYESLLFHLTKLQPNRKTEVYSSRDLCRRLPFVSRLKIPFASRKCVAHTVWRKWFPPAILFPRNFECITWKFTSMLSGYSVHLGLNFPPPWHRKEHKHGRSLPLVIFALWPNKAAVTSCEYYNHFCKIQHLFFA